MPACRPPGGRSAPRSAGRCPRAAGDRHRRPRPGRGAEAHQQSTGRYGPASLPARLGVERYTLVNDFGAVAHAVAQLGEEHFSHLCGPDRPLARGRRDQHRRPRHRPRSRPTAPPRRPTIMSSRPRAVISASRRSTRSRSGSSPGSATRYGRVSAERVASGPGLANLYEALAAIEGATSRFARREGAVGRRPWPARTASPPPRSTSSAGRSAPSPATSRWPRARGRW